jgi:hypothetical protein
MIKGRPLTERESSLVNTLKQQARIRAEIMWLEARIGRYRKFAAVEQADRLASLRAQLSGARMNPAKEQRESPNA